MKRLNHKEYFNTDQLGSNLKNRALRGAGATMFSNVAMFGIQMIGTVVLARLLRPDDFGLVAMVAAFSLLFQNVGLRGLTEATIQSEVIDHKKISKLFWIHVGLSLLLTLCFIALTPVMIWLYKDPRLELITIVIAMSFVFTALSTQHLALLVRNMQFYRITGIEIMATIVTQVVAITMAIQGYEYWALVGRRIAPMVATAVGAWILCRWIPGLPVQSTGVGSMLKFGMNTYGNFATNYL
jgi:O-antigen/teichoic acid export membrane protein